MNRPSKNEWLMAIAMVNAMRSSCVRRKVGAVITNADHHILSCGYNGPPSELSNCTSGFSQCPGANAQPGTNLDDCRAIHAEQNAIARLADCGNADRIYVTAKPCFSCSKILSATNIRYVYWLQDYPGSDFEDYWRSLGRFSNRILETPLLSLLSDTLDKVVVDF